MWLATLLVQHNQVRRNHVLPVNEEAQQQQQPAVVEEEEGEEEEEEAEEAIQQQQQQQYVPLLDEADRRVIIATN